MDYNIETKQIKINLYLPHYEEIKQYQDLKENIDWIVMQIIGEIAFRKHIKHIDLNQLPFDANGLLDIAELPDYIYYLDKINSIKKTQRFGGVHKNILNHFDNQKLLRITQNQQNRCTGCK